MRWRPLLIGGRLIELRTVSGQLRLGTWHRGAEASRRVRSGPILGPRLMGDPYLAYYFIAEWEKLAGTAV